MAGEQQGDGAAGATQATRVTQKGREGTRWKRRVPLWIEAALGLAVGLAASEAMFWVRDRGAFPHLNSYVADPALGVRLRPGATQRVSFGGNPVTQVRVNASGFRGADWPAPGGDEVLVIGDSQVFGLGVEEGESLAAGLEKELGGGTRVLNAGVPTWGPVEYRRALDELLPERKPKTVVYVVNFVNDPFEAARPNTERHAVWDGWAVRKETAPASVASFPGRDLLFRRSHAVFALRQWLYRRGGPERDDRGFASEGTWRDLVTLRGEHTATQTLAADEIERRGRLQEARARYAARAALAAELHVKLLAYETLKLDPASNTVYLSSHANPGDIVVPQLGEEGRPLAASVEYIRQAADLRHKFEERLRAEVNAPADAERAKEIARSLAERDALEKRLEEVLAEPVELVRAGFPMLRVVEETKAAVEASGARFVLLVLPLDVQVSADEWKKYGQAPVDLAGTEVLVRDLAEGTRALGATALDATEALRAAEPGAFLNGDPHLSPKGHAAVAKALAAAMREAPPRVKPMPLLALPRGRSRLPRPEEWATQAGEVLVTGSTAAGCSTRRLREWLYVRCMRQDNPHAPVPAGVKLDQGGHGDTLTWAADGTVTLVAPVVRGDELRATFTWTPASPTNPPLPPHLQAQQLVARWPAEDVVPTMGFERLAASAPAATPAAPAAPAAAGTTPAPAATPAAATTPAPVTAARPSPAHQAITACWSKVYPGRSPGEIVASADDDCVRTYGEDCAKLLECATGWPARPPRCEPGEVNAGAALHCRALCGEAKCPEGQACVDTQGARQCVEAAAATGSTFGPPDEAARAAASRPVIASPPKPPSAEQVRAFDDLAFAALTAMQKALEACKLDFEEPRDWFSYDFFDVCAWKEQDVPAVVQAVAAAEAKLKEAPELEEGKRADVLAQLRLFRDWLALSQRSGQSRGTLALFQEVAKTWNGYQVDVGRHVPPDPPHIVHQYTVDFGHPHVNYIAHSYKELDARKALGLPLPWRRGVHGPRLPNR